MKPATNLREIAPGLWAWSSLHEEWKVDFSCCAWNGPGGLVLVDPVKLDDANLAKLERIGKPAAILLTNQNHERDADWFRQRYGINIHVHRDAAPGIEITPDEFFCDGANAPGGLKVIHLPGASPSESAFHTELNGGILILGDVAVNLDEGLKFLSEEHCEDSKLNRQSARKLLAYEFETMTFAHGDPIHPKARQQFAKLFQA
jgi:glyoxylase-like metal-dependent hydrolase (beta-lactamase superfamily II)